MQPEDLKALVTTTIPFGKYQGRAICDLPEDYLLWFAKKGFPPYRLGQLMELMLLIQTEGLDNLLEPLKKSIIRN